MIEAGRMMRTMKKYGHDMVYRFASPMMQFFLNMTGRTKDPLLITSDGVTDQEAKVAVAGEAVDDLTKAAMTYYKFVLAFFLNEYDLAEQLARSTRLSKSLYSGTFVFCLHSFFEALTLMRLEQQQPFHQRRILRVKHLLKRLKKYEKLVPENCQNKVLLVEAELAAYRGNMDLALAKFTRSIDKAEAEGLIHEQALACERAGSALRRQSDFAGATPFLRRARTLYQQWGAHAKVKQMSKMYALDVVAEAISKPPGEDK